MISDPARWRTKVVPLVRVPGGVRPAAARAEMTYSLNEEGEFSETGDLQDLLKMTLPQYAHDMNTTEGMDPKKAESKFDDLLHEQDFEHSTETDDRVGILDIARERTYKGTWRSTKKGVKRTYSPDCPPASSRRGSSVSGVPRGRDPTLHSSRRFHTSPRPRPGHDTSPPSTIRRGQPSESEDDHSVSDGGRSRSCRSGRRGCGKSNVAKLTPANLGMLPVGRSPGSRSVGAISEASAITACVERANGLHKPVEFMKAKDIYKKQLEKLLFKTSVAKTLPLKVKPARQKLDLSKVNHKRIAGEVDEVLSSVSKACIGLQDVIDGLDGASRSEYERLQEDAHVATIALDEALVNLQDHLDAIVFVVSKVKEKQNQENSTKRASRMRLQRKIVVGGMGPSSQGRWSR